MIFPLKSTNQLVQWLLHLFVVVIFLLIIYILLFFILRYYKRKNKLSARIKENKLSIGQMAHAYTDLYPEKSGYIIVDQKDTVFFYKAFSNEPIEEGTAVVVIELKQNYCRVKPLISRVAS